MEHQSDLMKQGLYYLEQANLHLAKWHATVLNEFNLTPKQYMVLKAVEEHPGVAIQPIATRYDMSVSSVSQLITKLEVEGYVIRTINPSNRREVQLTLGPNGIAYFEATARVDALIFERYYAKLTREQAEQFFALAKRLHELIMEDVEDY